MPYPFEPKASRELLPGHYWGLPLCNGRYAAGVMLAHTLRRGKPDRSTILTGLLDWSGEQAPLGSDLFPAGILSRGFVHIRAIAACGGRVLGRIERDWGPAQVHFDELAGRQIPGWGLLVMRYRAEMRWGDAIMMRRELEAGRPGRRA